MAKQLTDREKKKIIADYAEMGSCNAVAKKHKRSWTTVKQVVESDPDKLLKAMSHDEIIGKSTISQIATAFGVVTDKFMTLRTQQEVHPLLKDIAEAMKEKH